MDHYEQFKKYASEEIGDLDILEGSEYVEELGTLLYYLGRYYIDEARKIDPELDADAEVDIDYCEHKNHFLKFYSDVQIGGRQYRVILDEAEYIYGKISDSPGDFQNESVAQVRSIIKNYHHVLNHVSPNPDREAYNPAEDPHEC